MNNQNVHPLLRYGGPVLGAVILYFIITTMIGGFQADLEAARLEPLAVAEEVVVDETPAAEAPAAAAPAQEAPVTDTGVVTETAVLTDTQTVTEVAPLAESVEVTTTVEVTAAVETTESTPLVGAAVVTDTVPLELPAQEAPEVVAVEPPVVTDTVPLELPAQETPEVVVAEPPVPSEPEPATPTTLAEMDVDAIYAGLPAEIAAFFPDGADAELGKETALTSGCTACHSLQPDVVQVGPSWYGVADRAVTRVPGQSPALYIYTSITQPNEYVVEGFQPDLMPAIYGQILSDEQIANIMAYLLTMDGE